MAPNDDQQPNPPTVQDVKMISVRPSEAIALDAMSVPPDLRIQVKMVDPKLQSYQVWVPETSSTAIIELLSDMLFYIAGDRTQALPRPLGNLLVKIASAFGTFPSGLFLRNVEMNDADRVDWGGFADIYKGRYEGKIVALKRFREHRQQGSKEQHEDAKEYLRKKFCKEVIFWRYLDHRNVLNLLGLHEGEDKLGDPYICMVSPWLQKGHLLQFVSDNDDNNDLKIAITEVNRLLFQAADGISYLHQLRIVHGDIRCANILIDDEGCARVTDFGLSSLIASEASASGTITEGSLRFNAPELFDENPIRTVNSDVYAFACTCLEIHTRKRPFPEIKNSNGIAPAILANKRPERPSVNDPHADQNDILWNMAKSCWTLPEHERPSMDTVKWELARLPGLEKCRRGLQVIQARIEEYNNNPETVN